MERVEIQTALTQADWQAYQTHWARRNLGGQRTCIVGVLIGAGIVLATAWLAHSLGGAPSLPSMLGGVLLGAFVSFYNAWRAPVQSWCSAPISHCGRVYFRCSN